MIPLASLLQRLDGLDPIQLSRWIESGWVRPEIQADVGGDCLFGEIDVARVELIRELQSLGIDEETMPLVLGLVDQIYSLRRRMRLLQNAIVAQAPEVQRSILDAVAKRNGG